jgi:formate hydrogenlyase subunit 3/multisubunit Na+/H+ antiporter MnhD subunit
MVSPFYILIVGLGLGFLLGLAGKKLAMMSTLLVLLAMAFFTAVAASWVVGLVDGSFQPQAFFSAGFKPPFAINLYVGLSEASVSLLVNVLGFLSALYFRKQLLNESRQLGAVMLVLFMGLNMLIFTRDLFNIFVFLEITAISTSGLILMDDNKQAHAAGFKYLLASSLISAFYLLGAVLVYFSTGSLFLDDFLALPSLSNPLAAIAAFLLIIALILELKPFPANGWALDVYEASHPGTGAIISGAVGTVMLFVLYKLMPAATFISETLITIGLVTFIASNLVGLSQHQPNRLLGYSSVGQIGLLVAIIGFRPFLGDKFEFIAITILISHFLAKAGLFWLSGIVKKNNIYEWSVLKSKPVLFVAFGTFIFVLTGFPPFPSFFGKWELIMQLARSGQFYWMASILAGSFLEGIYLLRWFSKALKLDSVNAEPVKISYDKFLPVVIFAFLSYLGGYYAGTFLDVAKNINYLPLIFIAFIALIDFLPAWIKNTISIIGVSIYIYFIYPTVEDDLLRTIFLLIFLGGAILTLFSGYYHKGKRLGFYPMALSMFAGLTMLITATNLFEILYGWELMTIGSYFLLIRGKKSLPHGYSYLMFSLAGSYAIMFGFALAYASFGHLNLEALKGITVLPTLAYSLMLIGFMTKTASFGVHIWLPGAHGEAVADIHFMASAILLKAGVFGIILVLLGMEPGAFYTKNIMFVLGWIGAISALIGNMGALFQESGKRLLAWSSIGQLGYIVFGLAMMSHLGWLVALFYSITHFMYKGILFLVIGGIALKLGTPDMYRMGGLIKKMPYSYIAVLVAIITLSGVPPLIGFAGKWLLYNAVISGGFYFQGIVVLFSGIVAFLYLFKLIYSIFLGQLKDEHRHVKEISVWFLIPVYLLLTGIMIISAKPGLLLQPLGVYLAELFPNGAIKWTHSFAETSLGYWNGTGVMITVSILFVLLLSWLYLLSRKAVKVGQFNIVYAAEAPQRPETTHVSYNIYAGYNKALGWIVAPKITEFWETATDWIHSLAFFLRLIYNGNGQVYLLYMMAYFLTIYFLTF